MHCLAVHKQSCTSTGATNRKFASAILVLFSVLFAATLAAAEDRISGADTAYYFSKSGKLLAVEDVEKVERSGVRSQDLADQDGLTLIMDSGCQSADGALVNETDMVGLAKSVVYVKSSPESLSVVFVEDLGGVKTRMVTPMKATGTLAGCCCALRRCGPVWCCPCATNC